MLTLLLVLSLQAPGDWPVYGRDPGGARFSPLTQITRGNVAQLQVAWIYHAGIPDMSSMSHRPPALEVTPLVIDGTMYVITPTGIIAALAPASGEVRAFDVRTGAQKWSFDPIPQDSTDPAFKTWQHWSASRTGGANVWSVIVADPARDLVFLPTSSPAPDYFGGMRLGEDRY